MEEQTITFWLRQGVKFHDGSELNAEGVKWHFDNFREFAGDKIRWEGEVVDEYTFRIRYVEGESFENTDLTYFSSEMAAFITCKAAFDAHGEEWCRRNPIGTGPFKCVEYELESHCVLEKFEDYWQESLPYLDRIRIEYIPEATTVRDAMIAGDIIACRRGGPDNVASELINKHGFEFEGGLQATIVFLFDRIANAEINHPTSNLKVRQAMEHAINREELVDTVGFGIIDEPAYQYLPPGYTGRDPNFEHREYNPEKAKQLLAEAGYPDGFDVTIYFHMDVSQDFGIAIQSYLAEVGIKAELQWTTPTAYLEYRFNSDKGPGVILCEPRPSAPNTNSFPIGLFSKDAAFGFAKALPYYVTEDEYEEFYELWEKTRKSINVDAELVRPVFQFIHDHALHVPLAYFGRLYVWNGDVLQDPGFYSMGDSTVWPYENWWLKK